MATKNKVKKGKVQLLGLEFGTMQEMQFHLNHYLNSGWLLLDLKSEHNDFFASHSAWLCRKILVARMNKQKIQGGF